jgi:hypothetical protein
VPAAPSPATPPSPAGAAAEVAPSKPAPRPPAAPTRAAPAKPPSPPVPGTAKPARKLGRPPTAASTAAAERGRERARRVASKLAVAFWEAVASGERWPRKQVASGSPLSVLYRLYGPDGPACAVGILPGQSWRLARISMMTAGGRPGLVQATGGTVELDDGSSYPYTLRWLLEGGKAVVEEVLPFRDASGPLLPPRTALEPALAERLYDDVPGTPVALDPVAAALWGAGPSRLGLPLAARCLAAWWRLRDPPGSAPRSPAALAAALAALVGRCAGAWHPVEAAVGALGADPAEVAAAADELQQRLRLSAERPW